MGSIFIRNDLLKIDEQQKVDYRLNCKHSEPLYFCERQVSVLIGTWVDHYGKKLKTNWWK